MQRQKRPHLTRRQKEALDVIRKWTRKRGLPPTYEEIGGEMGCSPVTAWEHVDWLVRKGYALREDGVQRSVEVVE